MIQENIIGTSETGTMDAVEEDDQVRITHYINPHCFWYKPETAYIPHLKQRQFLEEFNEYCEGAFEDPTVQQQPQRYGKERNVPSKVGDLVAQYNRELQRWIRCQVEDIFVALGGEVWYQLWAIDEGVPIKSVQADFHPLPKAYTGVPGHAKRGALKNILPAETRYDYVQGKNVNKTRTTWCSGVVSALQTCLDDASSLRIVEHEHFLVNHEAVHFVEIFMWTHDGKNFNIVDLLRDACSDLLIVSPDEQFFKAVFKGKTFNMVRYKNNDGIDNTPLNRKSDNPTFLGTIKVAPDTPNVQIIVGDWFSRNKEAIDGKDTDNAATLDTKREKNVQGEKKTYGSSEAPNEEGKQNTIIVPHTSEVSDISTAFSNMLKLQQRRERLEISNRHPVSTKPPLVGPAGCSIKKLLNNTNNKPYD